MSSSEGIIDVDSTKGVPSRGDLDLWVEVEASTSESMFLLQALRPVELMIHWIREAEFKP